VAVTPPPTHYAKVDGLSIAYQTFGQGSPDLVLVLGFVSHLDLQWRSKPFVEALEDMARHSRVIIYDKRGTGLSDPVENPPTLEDRMRDMEAVLDAAGSEKVTPIGWSEGGALSMLFAATHPDRVEKLILYGAMAKATYSEDHPWNVPSEDLLKANNEFIGPHWGQGAILDVFAPSVADDPDAREFMAHYERQAAPPKVAYQLFRMFLDVDVRHIVPSIGVPTLVMHRRHDRAVNVRNSRWLADNIPGAKYVELEGIDHQAWVGDAESVLREIEEFVTGERTVPEPKRVLATVLFTDIVGSTKKATELGDASWRSLLGEHDDASRRAIASFGGREIKTTGDGFMVRFDGPAQAIRCARAIAEQVRPLGIEIRSGVHTGESDLGGVAVHIASRVCSLAAPSEVLATGVIKGLVAGSGIRFEERGSHELRGIPDSWDLLAAV
jgi:pimeloyl-ACP methyl ester carboxylesterase